MSFWKKIGQEVGIIAADQTVAQEDSAALADAVITAREALYSEHFGTLPQDILKMANLVGRWPGGGIYKIESRQQNGNTRWIYISSGLSNPDIPAIQSDSHTVHDEEGRIESVNASLQSDGNTLPPTGYGYEIMVVTEQEADWPLLLLQWAINAELTHGIDLLSRVEQYQGVTVGDIPLGEGQSVNLLIQKAQAPFPPLFALPNGDIALLLITTITPQELEWSLQHSRDALLAQLLASPVGQLSILERDSVTD